MPLSVQLPKPPRDVRLATNSERAAYERGLRDGEATLREQLLTQRNEFLELQRGVLDSLRQAVPQVVHDSESALIALALEAAQRLVAGMPVSAEMVQSVVRESLAQVEDTTEITVSLHPEDLALLQPAAENKMHFQASPEVTRGGCLVQTRFGVIDARRETKLELLKGSLTT